jgi:hypothetical protein
MSLLRIAVPDSLAQFFSARTHSWLRAPTTARALHECNCNGILATLLKAFSSLCDLEAPSVLHEVGSAEALQSNSLLPDAVLPPVSCVQKEQTLRAYPQIVNDSSSFFSFTPDLSPQVRYPRDIHGRSTSRNHCPDTSSVVDGVTRQLVEFMP